MLLIALPISIQQLVTSSAGIIDNLMVSGLGSIAVGSVGAINKFINIFWFSMYGLTSGGATFTNQFLAKGDYEGVKKILGITLSLNICVALIFTYFSFFHSTAVATIFTNDPQAIDIGHKYLYTLFPYFILSAIPYAYSYPLRSMGKAHITMYIIIMSQLVNVFFNYVLITGKLGFPALGVEGAAFATVSAKVIETVAMMFVVYGLNNGVAATIDELLNFRISFFVNYLKVVSPLALNEVLWSLGLMIYQILIGGISPIAIAAYGMVAPFEQLLISMFSGFANAALVMVGKALGNEKYDEAYNLGKRVGLIAPSIAAMIGLIVFIFSKNIMSLYSLTGKISVETEVFREAVMFLRVLAICMFIRVHNLVYFAGVLKSGGDSIFLFTVGTLSLWLIGIPIVFLISNLGLPIYIIYFSTYIEEIIKSSFIRSRFKNKRWMKTLINLD